MNWIQRMNWSFLEEDVAKRVWDKAYQLYFEEDKPLHVAFTRALESEGFTVEHSDG